MFLRYFRRCEFQRGLYQDLWRNVLWSSHIFFNVILMLRGPVCMLETFVKTHELSHVAPAHRHHPNPNIWGDNFHKLWSSRRSPKKPPSSPKKSTTPTFPLIANFYLYAMRGNNENQMRRRRESWSSRAFWWWMLWRRMTVYRVSCFHHRCHGRHAGTAVPWLRKGLPR